MFSFLNRMDEDEEDPGTPTAAWESPPVESPSQVRKLVLINQYYMCSLVGLF